MGGRGSRLSRSSHNHIGSKDPDALKIPARRAEYSLTGSALSPFQAEPTHLEEWGFCERGIVRHARLRGIVGVELQLEGAPAAQLELWKRIVDTAQGQHGGTAR